MKILLTSDWYASAVNGVVTSIRNLRMGLEAMGHEVRILTLSQNHHSYTEDGVTYIGSLPAGIVYPGARLGNVLAKKEVCELVKWNPDIIHSNCEFSTFPLARKIASYLDIPLVHTYHTVYENYTHYVSPSEKWGKRVVRVLTRRIASQTDAIIAPTQKVKRLLMDYHVFTPIHVVHTGIDIDCFRAQNEEREMTRKELGILAGHTVLIFVGRLAKEKNCGELLKAVSECNHADVALLFVGDGPCRGELEKQAADLGLGNRAFFAGMAPPEEVSRYYHAGDLFVSASSSETQGLTYLEALSSSLPLLCRKDECLDGVLLDGVNGWQYQTQEEFLDRLELFLAHPEIKDALSHEAIRSSHGFTVAAFAKNAEQVYRQQIAHHQLKGGIAKWQRLKRRESAG